MKIKYFYPKRHLFRCVASIVALYGLTLTITSCDRNENTETSELPNELNSISNDLTIVIRDITQVSDEINPNLPARINSISVAPGQPDRLYVVDMDGPVYILEKGVLNPTPFMNMKERGNMFIHDDMEKGISSIAFHPDFNIPSTFGYGRLYTSSTESYQSGTANVPTVTRGEAISHHDVIAEWRIDPKNPDHVDFSSRREILRIAHPFRDHTIGTIAFNPSSKSGDAEYGLLYIGVGDGGNTFPSKGETDYYRTSQNGALPFGKILRINPMPGNDRPYSIPADNPFVNNADFIPEVWAYGFRNPQRFSWDTSSDHRMFIADIGQAKIEEVNIGVKGGNYGWSDREGTFLTNHKNEVEISPINKVENGQFIYPIAQYSHDVGKAISGGYIYRGNLLPELQGAYIFGDIATGDIFFLDPKELGGKSTITGPRKIQIKHNGKLKSLLEINNKARSDLHFGMDGYGELYILTKTDGVIRKLTMLEKIDVR
ncbi:MAG: PQQ-dependent sugar dehydrogenase [Gammaproteobacteria bacterium]